VTTKRLKGAARRKSGDVLSVRRRLHPVEAHVPGHPSLTLKLVEDLLTWIARGGSLRKWCEADGHPRHPAVLKALRESDELRTRYARAREDQADYLVDECLEIADAGQSDLDDQGRVRTDVIQRAKLRCDERHWQAAKLKPKVYGEKLAITDETPPRPLEAVQARILFLTSKAAK
jgi:hypothetical protein